MQPGCQLCFSISNYLIKEFISEEILGILMTSQILIMNRLGFTLASDSAVSSGKFSSNSVQKIFLTEKTGSLLKNIVMSILMFFILGQSILIDVLVLLQVYLFCYYFFSHYTRS